MQNCIEIWKNEYVKCAFAAKKEEFRLLVKRFFADWPQHLVSYDNEGVAGSHIATVAFNLSCARPAYVAFYMADRGEWIMAGGLCRNHEFLWWAEDAYVSCHILKKHAIPVNEENIADFLRDSLQGEDIRTEMPEGEA